MNKQKSDQMASLRKKLLAAIAMLLVACIMTVSSTYAWFTLSTAPEVKGISTTVGANGNLEMALAYWDIDTDAWGDPASAVGNSSANTKDGHSVMDSNITWGNLVDLSNGYGLNAIKLYPTRLNMAEGAVVRAKPLKFPVYGADGRISVLSDATVLGTFGENSFSTLPDGDPVGVNAIGSVSNMTPRQNDIRNYKAAILTQARTARNLASQAITSYGGMLSSLALKELGSDATVDATTLSSLSSLIALLDKSNNAISESLKATFLVVLGAARNEDETSKLTDNMWQAVVNKANETNVDIVDFVNWLTGEGTNNAAGITVPEEIDKIIDLYSTTENRINAAASALSAAAVASPANTWSDVKPAVTNLIDSDDLMLSDGVTNHTVAAIQSDFNLPADEQQIVPGLMQAAVNGNVSIKFIKDEMDNTTDSVFAEIANLAGSYDASLTFPVGTSVGGVNLGGMTFPVTVEATGNYLVKANGLVEREDAPGADQNAAQALSDTFGYMIDLLFRTNASESYLQLQTTAANRYMDGASSATQGNGSNMTFTIAGKNTEAVVKNLAKGIRVVFFDTAGEIQGVAILDADNAVATGDGLKIDLKLTKYDFDAEGRLVISRVVTDEDGNKVEELGLKVDDGSTAKNEAVALMELASNTKTALSALVYLDGDVITNAEASLEDLQAILNLQFSSSADLTPMVNDALKNMGE